MLLDKQKFKAFKPKLLQVDIPELDGFVYARSLTANQLREAERAREDGAEGVDLLYMQAICAICDETGKPIFAEDDKELVANLPFSVVKRMSEAVQEASGISPVKNSE